MAQCIYFISLNNAFFTEQEGEECQLIQKADSVANLGANLGAVAGGGDDDDDDDQQGITSAQTQPSRKLVQRRTR